MKPIRFSATALLVLAGLTVAGAAGAQTRPGVGYDPQARGLYYSRYKLDSLNSSFLSYRMDFSADPGAVGTSPNPYYFSFGDLAVVTAYEQRYGPNTAGPRFKAFIGPNNEVRFIVHDALVWWFAHRASELGGDTANRNGQPTEVEITDAQATGDRPIWITYMQSALDGYAPDRPLQINDPTKPPGDFQVTDPFWNIPLYYHNAFHGYYPFSPQVPVP